MARRGGYKGFGASYKRKANYSMTNFIYSTLGGEVKDKRVSRKNPTTGNFIQSITSDDEYYYQKGKYSAAKENKTQTKRTKDIYQLDENGELVKKWNSAKEIEEESNNLFKVSGVQKACRENKIYKGYYWKY